MALHDTKVRRFFATGIAGLSCAVDSLSAIKYAKVYPVRNEEGIVTDFRIEGDFPKYGNNDDRADNIAVWLLKTFMTDIKSHYTYRESIPTTSILIHYLQRRVRQKDRQHARRSPRGDSPLRPAPIPCTAGILTGLSLPSNRWRNFPMSIRGTEFPIPSRLLPARWARTRINKFKNKRRKQLCQNNK